MTTSNTPAEPPAPAPSGSGNDREPAPSRGRDFARTAWLLLIIAIPLGLWFLLPSYSREAGSSSGCSAPSAPIRQPHLDQGVVAVPLVLEKPEGVTIDLWRNRQAQSRTVFLQAAKTPLPPGATKYAALPTGLLLNVSQRALDRQELDGTIGPDRYVAIANVAPRKEIRLTICVDPTAPDVDPGTYVGTVRVFSPLIQPLTVPVTVTLQQPGFRWIVPVFGIAILLAGSFTVWASGKKAQQAVKSPQDGPPHGSVWLEIGELPSWMMNNYVGVVAGAIAAISVFIARYWRSAAWGARAPEDWLALFGSMFTAFTAALAAASALVPQRPKTGDKVRGPTTPSMPDGPDADDQARITRGVEGGPSPETV